MAQIQIPVCGQEEAGPAFIRNFMFKLIKQPQGIVPFVEGTAYRLKQVRHHQPRLVRWIHS